MTDWNDNFTNHALKVMPNCTGLWPHKSVQITSYSMIMFLSLVGNSFIVAAFYRNKTLRTTVHYFIVNMAISDLILPVIVLPWLITEIYHDYMWLVDGVLGSILCKLLPVSFHISVTVSIFNMVTISVDRFHAVLFPMKPALISPKTCRFIIFATWASSVAFRAQYFKGLRLVRYETGLYCFFQGESLLHSIEKEKVTWISWLCLAFLSTIVLTVLYSSIITFLYRQKNKLKLSSQIVQERAKRNRRITYMLVIVVVAFYVLCTPSIVLVFIRYLNPKMFFELPCFFHWFGAYILPMLYPVVNPIIYYKFNKEYHKSFRELLCCPWSCNNISNHCFKLPLSPQVENNVPNVGQANDAVENIELQEQGIN